MRYFKIDLEENEWSLIQIKRDVGFTLVRYKFNDIKEVVEHIFQLKMLMDSDEV